jgi:hypothetical protein
MVTPVTSTGRAIVSRLLLPEQDNIPTLTDVVKSSSSRAEKTADAYKNNPRNPESGSGPTGEITSIDRQQLEKLIYKKLHQNLPELCRQLADSIIAEFSPDLKTDTNKTGKPGLRR